MPACCRETTTRASSRKAADVLGLAGAIVPQGLDDAEALGADEAALLREVHLAHAAAPQGTQEDIVAHSTLRTGHQGYGSGSDRRDVMCVFLVPLLLTAATPKAATAPAPPAAPPMSLAPIVVEGLTLDGAARVERSLRRAFEARPGAVADSVARPLYEAARSHDLTCDVTATDCLAQIGVVQGVDVIVLARVGASTLELVAVDVGNARPVRRSKGPLRSAVLDADVDAALDALATPAATSTVLTITAPSATVSVDGAPRGLAPIAPIGGLDPGRHDVSVALDGVVATEQVTVALGETTAVTLLPRAAGDDDGSDDDRGRPRARGPSVVALGVGGGLAAVGTLSFLVGTFTWLELGESAAALEVLAAEAEASGTARQGFVNDVQVARDRFDVANETWAGAGQPAVALGLGLVGAGVGVLVTALVVQGE